jgi:hypothetical protein
MRGRSARLFQGAANTERNISKKNKKKYKYLNYLKIINK